MNVATRIIDKLGGHQAVADLLGCHVTRVYRWTYSLERGGTGGLIPLKQQRLLIAKMPERLRLNDFAPREGDAPLETPAKAKRKRAA